MAEDQKNLKEKAAEELRLMLVITAFLAAVFVSFLTYRRLISREFGVTSFHYGFAILEALIVAKVILIGKAIGIGKKSSGRVLFRNALRDSVVYALLVGVFAILEHVVEGLFHHETLAASIQKILEQGLYEILGRTLIVFVAFIPFFTLWELDRALGERTLISLLFRKRATPAGS
ncbi:MAG TPA: hypothetical protein VMN82_05280 [Thermoanaerobaculia bacterium]|nr:hypothetical protein [Thermoanaerobaculia bacterium]